MTEPDIVERLEAENKRLRAERANDCRYIERVRAALSDVMEVIHDRERYENKWLREALSDVLEVVNDRQVPIKDRIANAHAVATLALARLAEGGE